MVQCRAELVVRGLAHMLDGASKLMCTAETSSPSTDLCPVCSLESSQVRPGLAPLQPFCLSLTGLGASRHLLAARQAWVVAATAYPCCWPAGRGPLFLLCKQPQSADHSLVQCSVTV